MVTVGCYRDGDWETMHGNSWDRENRHALICMYSDFFFLFKLSRATKRSIKQIPSLFIIPSFPLRQWWMYRYSVMKTWVSRFLPVDQGALTIWLFPSRRSLQGGFILVSTVVLPVLNVYLWAVTFNTTEHTSAFSWEGHMITWTERVIWKKHRRAAAFLRLSGCIS